MVPHLSRYHCESEQESQQSPQLFVLQKLEIVTFKIKESCDERDKHNHSNRSRIVWWSKYANLSVCSFLYPLCDSFSRNTNALNVHGIAVLLFSFRWEVHENRSCVEAKHLENIRAFVKINHREEKFVRIE